MMGRKGKVEEVKGKGTKRGKGGREREVLGEGGGGS